MRRTLTTLFLLAIAACGGDGGGGGDDGGNVSNTSGTIQLGSTTYDVTEGEMINIVVTRSGGSSGVASVDYATSDGTAVAGTDYPATSGTLTFADGVSGNQTISIPITDDNTAEVAETFTVTLTNVSGATLGVNSSATVSIVDAPVSNAQNITKAVLRTAASTLEIIDALDVLGLPVPASTECDSGEATVTWNDLDNNLEVSTGDTFDVVFEMCFVADIDKRFNGAMALTNLVVTGDPFNQIAPWSLALTISFDDLIGPNTTDTHLRGDLDLDMNSEDNVVVDLSIATASLSAIDMTGFNIETLSDYVLTATLDLNALTQVVNTSGTFESNPPERAVTFETLQDFVIMGDDNPSAGQVLISDSSSSVLVTVLDNINVQLDIDTNLDGTIDQTIVVTWAELDID